MSAIVRTFTPEGFVVAADGRQLGAEDRTVETDTAQKVFPIISPCGSIALSICGAVRITNEDRSAIAVSLIKETLEAADFLRNKRTKNLYGYALRLSRQIHAAMKEAVASGRIVRYPECFERAVGEAGSTIARIMLDGDYNNRPSSVSIRIFHDNGVLAEPEVLQCALQPGMHTTCGSDVVAKILWEPDDDKLTGYRGTRIFSVYRGRWVFAEDMTLAEAIGRSRRYIEACSDPEVLALDKTCETIGGHIHIATITPQNGFRWIIPPIAE